MNQSFTVRCIVVLAGGLLVLASGFAEAGCSCGFGPENRAQADKELWLNKRDQTASIDKHLPWGMPKSKTVGSVFRPLVQRDYVIGYSTELLVPLWTAHRLTKQTIEAREDAKKAATDKARKNCFRADPRLNNGETAFCSNYDEPVFDQGHLVPDADMPARPISSLVNSYILSNVTPQYCHFNRGVWLFFEGMVREWAREKGEVTVLSGSVFDHDAVVRPDSVLQAKHLKTNKYGGAPAIPTHFYKVVTHKAESGDTESISILLPHINQKMTRQEAKEYLAEHIVTVNTIEKMTGLDFPLDLATLKSSRREDVERFLAPALWETEGGLPSTFDAACR